MKLLSLTTMMMALVFPSDQVDALSNKYLDNINGQPKAAFVPRTPSEDFSPVFSAIDDFNKQIEANKHSTLSILSEIRSSIQTTAETAEEFLNVQEVAPPVDPIPISTPPLPPPSFGEETELTSALEEATAAEYRRQAATPESFDGNFWNVARTDDR